MDKQEAKRQELLELGKEQSAEEREIWRKHGCLDPEYKPKGFIDFPEMIELTAKYKAKYIAICEKYK
ncbi:MAG: hypothetical protein ACI4KA_08015 [Oscillospiraceae bacterium]